MIIIGAGIGGLSAGYWLSQRGYQVEILEALDRSGGRMLPDELAEQRYFFESVVQAPLPVPVFFLDRPVKKDVWAYSNQPTVKRTFRFAVDGSSTSRRMQGT